MSERRVDPDLEQVLVDLEADPQAGLFLAEPRKLIRGLQDGSLLVRPSRTGLSAAERELLKTHRHELAWFLREAWLREFIDHPSSLQATIRFSVSSREDLRKLWETRRKMMPQEVRSSLEAGLLHSYLHPTGEPSLPTKTSLIWASLMVEDRPHARVFLGMDHLFSDQPLAALRILSEVARGPASSLLRAQAESFAGVAFLSLERPDKALLCYLQAYHLTKGTQVEGRSLEHLFNVLAIALLLRDEGRLIWTSERIRGLPVPSETFVVELARRIRAGGAPNEFVVGEDVRVFAVRIADKLDSTSREFVDGLLSLSAEANRSRGGSADIPFEPSRVLGVSS